MIIELRLKTLCQQATEPVESMAKFQSVHSLRVKAAGGTQSAWKVNNLGTKEELSLATMG